MTNKQIIIDGVDVSGCCQYMPRYMEDYDIDTLDYCGYHFKPCKDVDVQYCYYKQLKAKEEECEELKKKNHIFEDEYKILEDNLDSRTRDFEDVIDSYKQTLTEIKEIAEDQKDVLESMRIDIAERILNKISEVLDENI